MECLKGIQPFLQIREFSFFKISPSTKLVIPKTIPATSVFLKSLLEITGFQTAVEIKVKTSRKMMPIFIEDAADSFNRSWGMTIKFQDYNLTGITLPLSK